MNKFDDMMNYLKRRLPKVQAEAGEPGGFAAHPLSAWFIFWGFIFWVTKTHHPQRNWSRKTWDPSFWQLELQPQ